MSRQIIATGWCRIGLSCNPCTSSDVKRRFEIDAISSKELHPIYEHYGTSRFGLAYCDKFRLSLMKGKGPFHMRGPHQATVTITNEHEAGLNRLYSDEDNFRKADAWFIAYDDGSMDFFFPPMSDRRPSRGAVRMLAANR